MPLPHNPLSTLGRFEARYYALRLTGLVPLQPDHIPPEGHTTLATFSLQTERAHPRSNYDSSLHIPHHPRNALLLQALTAAFDARNSTATTSAPRQHAYQPNNTGRPVFAPTMPYPMAYNSMEFFPLSSLNIPHDITPEYPINLTDWFVGDCLAAAHTYTKLMDSSTRAHFGIATRYHQYEQVQRPDFYVGGHGYAELMSGIFYADDEYSPETARVTVHDLIDSPDTLATPLPPRNQWFKLTAAARKPTELDVGPIGEIRRFQAWDPQTDRPYTHHAVWMDYTLTRPSDPDYSRAFAAPYFSTYNHRGWLYQYADQATEFDAPLRELDATALLPGGFNIAHDLRRTTSSALMEEARTYAHTLNNQRLSRLAHLAEQRPASVVYSDLRCFTTAGRHDLTRMSTSFAILTRVNLPTHDTPATPHECVADEMQYVKLHQLMSTYMRDERMSTVADARTRDNMDVQNNQEVFDLHITEQRARLAALAQGNAGLVSNPDEVGSLAKRGPRLGRPKGARAVMTHERFVKAVAALALQADNALRPQPMHTRIHPDDIHNPTDSWTRLTPLMPPAPGSDLDTARYGRALPIRAINNQRIDSLLWRSLLNRWVNHPTMRETEAQRPPVVQITPLIKDMAERIKDLTLPPEQIKPLEHVDYTAGTKLALATVYIPIPASVMHRWLLEGPTNSEVTRVLPKTVTVPGGLFGRYVDPCINPATQQHERMDDYPEAMLVKGRFAQPVNQIHGIKCLPNPNRRTSWLLTPADIPWEVNLSPMVPTPRTE